MGQIKNGGLKLTEWVFGTAPLDNLYKAISHDDARATMNAAWEGGVRYFDTAPHMAWVCQKLGLTGSRGCPDITVAAQMTVATQHVEVTS